MLIVKADNTNGSYIQQLGEGRMHINKQLALNQRSKYEEIKKLFSLIQVYKKQYLLQLFIYW